MKTSFSYADLDQLTGEVLPERAVLSTVVTPFNNGGMGGGDHGATVSSACQSTHHEGTPGLLGSLGLGSNNPSQNLACTPAAIASH